MNKILVPIDLSENSINALKYANALATIQQATIIVLNIYTGDVSNYEVGWPISEDIDAVKPERKELIIAIIKQYCTVPTTFEIVEGNVVDTITTYATSNDVSLVIMGTHGATGLRAVLWGSNTSNVVAKSTIPVLAIPIDFSFTTIEKVVYASDFKDFNDEINQVLAFAKSIGATIEVLHLSYDNDEYENYESQFNSFVKQYNDIQISLKQRKISMEEPLTKHLKEYMLTQKNGLLAMFTQERDWLDKLFLSSKTEELANDVDLAILSFKKI